jgi:CRP-like cAMP-binding protein
MEPTTAPDIASYRREWPATSFLAQISESAAGSCFVAGRFARFSPQETLIRQYTDQRSVFLLISGCVKVTADLEAADTRALLAIRVGGDVLGELSAMDGQRRSATVQVCGREPAIACVIDGPEFFRVLTKYPDALLTLTAAVGVKLRAATRRRVDFLNCTAPVRMARALVELADDHGQRVPEGIMIGVNLKQIELGTLIGVHEAAAQRALRRLRQAGLVETSHRRPIIRDIERLRAVAQLDVPAKTIT